MADDKWVGTPDSQWVGTGDNRWVGAGVTLLAPANLSTGVGWPVEFSWQAVVGANYYRLQVADDAEFTTPVIDETVADTVYEATDDDLIQLTEYFWRVAPYFES